MVDYGDRLASGLADGPRATEEVDLVIGIATTSVVNGEMKVEEAGVWARA
jgi:hypothetical protein